MPLRLSLDPKRTFTGRFGDNGSFPRQRRKNRTRVDGNPAASAEFPFFARTNSESRTAKVETCDVLPTLLLKPRAHEGNLALLGLHDFLGELANFRILAMYEQDFRHVDRALMVGDHAAHEIGIGVA